MAPLVGGLLALLAFVPARAADFGPLLGNTYGSGTEAVVVVLHGDMSSGGAPTYHFAIARALSDAAPRATAIALFRPGYGDGFTRRSPGDNHDRWDQYTRANNDLVAETLESIRAAWPGAKVIVAGHSGGAAQTAAVIGRYPGLVDTAVLVSCPCDFGPWRARYNRQLVRSADQNPQGLIASIAPGTRILAITGAEDDNTFPGLAKAYVAAAQAAGLDATFVSVPGANHWNDTLKDSVIRLLLEEVNE